MTYIATIRIYELGPDFTPAKLQTEYIQQLDDFPIHADYELQTRFMKARIARQFDKDLINALSFEVDLRTDDFSNRRVFVHQDYFEPDPRKRCYRKWRWDKERNIAIGTTLFADDLN